MKKQLISIMVLSLLGACTTSTPMNDTVLAVGSSHAKLAGTSWQWDSGQSNYPHITFLANGHIRGSTGCNAISGVYEETSDIKDGRHVLKLGELITTEMACLNGMETEAAFLQKLGNASTFKLSGDRLRLYSTSGEMLAGLDPKSD